MDYISPLDTFARCALAVLCARRASSWAHQRAIADSIGAPGVPRRLFVAALGGHRLSHRRPILAVLPVESDCRAWLVDDVERVSDL